MVAGEPSIKVVREEVRRLDPEDGEDWILATGPLTSEPLQEQIEEWTGDEGLHFFDAIAPTVTLESLDLDLLFRAARYDRGDADYLNAALDAETYHTFHSALLTAEKADVHGFDRTELFSGCLPIEEIAASGPESLVFGPLRPVGLTDPGSGRRPPAVIQLRQENRAGSLYGLVGFQTRLKFGEQKRVFRLIPGLARAEFVRLGQMHRNFYVDTPRCLHRNFALSRQPRIRLAGQITGVEGYVESITSGLVTAWMLAAERKGITLPAWPANSLIGALLSGFLFDTTSGRLSPMNVNFGLLSPLAEKVKGKRQRRLALAERALKDLDAFLDLPELRHLLAASGAR